MTLIRALAMLPGMIFERWLLVVLLAFVLTSTGWAQTLERVVGGLALPVAITHAGDGSGRLFVTEQRGTVRVVEDGRLLDTPFLDLRALVRDGGERGLLSLAFHPGYRDNGLLFVYYTDTAGDTVVARYQVGDDPNLVDPDSATVVLTWPQPFGNHNGGQLAFGPSGFLYVGLGDGGSGGDPLEAGQRLDTLLGKILRLDIDCLQGCADGAGYGIPNDNPFVEVAGARPEIWAYGLRNPWRFSFDRASGDLFIGDVGQNRAEEIDRQPAGSPGGENYGWRITEGEHCFDPPSGCDRSGLEEPIVSYDHNSGWGRSITGGYRYRGADLPDLEGNYLFADYLSRLVFRVVPAADGSWQTSVLLEAGFSVSSFGEDEAGELYLADHRGGAIFRLGQ